MQIGWFWQNNSQIDQQNRSKSRNRLIGIQLFSPQQKRKVKVVQLYLTLYDPMDYAVPGILQPRILEWIAFPLLQGIFPIQGWNPGLLHCRQILYQLSHKGSTRILRWVAYPFSHRSPNPGIKPGSPALQVDS